MGEVEECEACSEEFLADGALPKISQRYLSQKYLRNKVSLWPDVWLNIDEATGTLTQPVESAGDARPARAQQAPSALQHPALREQKRAPDASALVREALIREAGAEKRAPDGSALIREAGAEKRAPSDAVGLAGRETDVAGTKPRSPTVGSGELDVSACASEVDSPAAPDVSRPRQSLVTEEDSDDDEHSLMAELFARERHVSLTSSTAEGHRGGASCSVDSALDSVDSAPLPAAVADSAAAAEPPAADGPSLADQPSASEDCSGASDVPSAASIVEPHSYHAALPAYEHQNAPAAAVGNPGTESIAAVLSKCDAMSVQWAPQAIRRAGEVDTHELTACATLMTKQTEGTAGPAVKALDEEEYSVDRDSLQISLDLTRGLTIRWTTREPKQEITFSLGRDDGQGKPGVGCNEKKAKRKDLRLRHGEVLWPVSSSLFQRFVSRRAIGDDAPCAVCNEIRVVLRVDMYFNIFSEDGRVKDLAQVFAIKENEEAQLHLEQATTLEAAAELRQWGQHSQCISKDVEPVPEDDNDDIGPIVPVCCLCKREADDKYGELLEFPVFKDGKSNELKEGKLPYLAHYSCAYFCQDSKTSVVARDQHFGLKATSGDIIKEFRRGQSLRCDICMEKGATLGCWRRDCAVYYHFPC
eukprot:SAG31_NODE_1536_length_7983_cov_4.341071_2_plen_644_part_00